MAHVRTRKEGRRRGAAAAEAAIVLPVILMVTFGAIKYGWLSLKAQQITNAARHGARMAILPDMDNNDGGEVELSIINLLGRAGIIANTGDIVITSYSLSEDPESPLYGRTAYKVYIEIPTDREGMDILLNFPWLPDWKPIKAQVIMAGEGN